MGVSSRLGVVVAIAGLLVPGLASAESVIEQDRERIQTHLKQVEAKLRQKDVSHLSPEQRRARERNLDRLHTYWKRGVFPHNDVTDERTPIFIDRDGRECAVGYLMVESGWEEEAKAISRRENLKRLPNMTSPEVAAWLKQSGLTAEEATMIQPGYSPCRDCGCQTDPVCGNNGVTYVNECVATKCGKAEAVNKGCCSADDDPVEAGETDDPFKPSCANWRDTGTIGGGTGDAGADTGADTGSGSSMVCQATQTTEAPSRPPPPGQACSTARDQRGPTHLGWWAVLLVGVVGLRRNR